MTYNSATKRTLIKRVCIIVSIIAFWTLAALTASLPLDLPSHQYHNSPSNVGLKFPLLNHGDTAWMIVATILGLMLSPMLAYFYGKILFVFVILVFIKSQ